MNVYTLLGWMGAAGAAGIFFAAILVMFSAMRRSSQISRFEERQRIREEQASAIKADQARADKAERDAYEAARTVHDNDAAVAVLRKHKLLRTPEPPEPAVEADVSGTGAKVSHSGNGRVSRNRLKPN